MHVLPTVPSPTMTHLIGRPTDILRSGGVVVFEGGARLRRIGSGREDDLCRLVRVAENDPPRIVQCAR